MIHIEKAIKYQRKKSSACCTQLWMMFIVVTICSHHSRRCRRGIALFPTTHDWLRKMEKQSNKNSAIIADCHRFPFHSSSFWWLIRDFLPFCIYFFVIFYAARWVVVVCLCSIFSLYVQPLLVAWCLFVQKKTLKTRNGGIVCEVRVHFSNRSEIEETRAANYSFARNYGHRTVFNAGYDEMREESLTFRVHRPDENRVKLQLLLSITVTVAVAISVVYRIASLRVSDRRQATLDVDVGHSSTP